MNINSVVTTTITDVSHSGNNKTYGQTGLVNGLRIDLDIGLVFNLICWSSTKQQMIRNFSFGAKILAAADEDDRGYSVKSTLLAFSPKCNIKH